MNRRTPWTHLAGWCALGALALHGAALAQADLGFWADGGDHPLLLALTPDLPSGQLPALACVGRWHDAPPPALDARPQRPHDPRGPPA